jgi:L-ascorbate metabolism protein UlaG (beta-lactamase superfamily)
MLHLKEAATGIARQWPRVIAESLAERTPVDLRAAHGTFPCHDEWHGAALGAFFVGQATAVVRIGGRTVITDPHFSHRAGVRVFGRAIGRHRSVALPCEPTELPAIDVVVLSHAHLDHWDRPSLKHLAHKQTIAVVPRKTRRLLPRGFGKVIEVDWEEEVRVDPLTITALRAAHWGARYVVDTRRGFNAYVIDSADERVVFSGDTAHTDAFDALGGHARGVDLAILGIGTYRRWEHAHATPEQAADMAVRMGAARVMPVHHMTFRDPEEPMDEPLERLAKVWCPTRTVAARPGESWLSGG